MNEDKKIEDFTAYLMKEIDVDIPSNDFVTNVMESIEVEAGKTTIITYKPLISKSVWGLIIILFSALSVFVITGSTVNHYLIEAIDLKIINDISEINLFKNIHFSKTFTFSFVLFSIFVIVQLYVIRRYFNKQHLI
jgi:hypothetical protein